MRTYIFPAFAPVATFAQIAAIYAALSQGVAFHDVILGDVGRGFLTRSAPLAGC
jgi:hypothetical protein